MQHFARGRPICSWKLAHSSSQITLDGGPFRQSLSAWPRPGRGRFPRTRPKVQGIGQAQEDLFLAFAAQHHSTMLGR